MKMEDVEIILKKAKVSDNFSKREKYLTKYQKKTTGSKKIIIIALIILIFLYIWMRKSLSLKYSIFLITIALIIAAFVVGGLIYISRRLKQKIEKVVDSNAPLLYFESDIVKVYERNKRINTSSHHSTKITLYYIILSNNIEIEISKLQFTEIISKNIDTVRLYFFEDILTEYIYARDVFDIELLQKGEL